MPGSPAATLSPSLHQPLLADSHEDSASRPPSLWQQVRYSRVVPQSRLASGLLMMAGIGCVTTYISFARVRRSLHAPGVGQGGLEAEAILHAFLTGLLLGFYRNVNKRAIEARSQAPIERELSSSTSAENRV